MNDQFGTACSLGGTFHSYITPTHQKQIRIILVYSMGKEVPNHECMPKVATNH